MGNADPAVAAAAVEAVTPLPESIELVSLRRLAWPMARLAADGVRLSLLSLEALAAANHLGAELCWGAADDNRPLLAAPAPATTGSGSSDIGRRPLPAVTPP